MPRKCTNPDCHTRKNPNFDYNGKVMKCIFCGSPVEGQHGQSASAVPHLPPISRAEQRPCSATGPRPTGPCALNQRRPQSAVPRQKDIFERAAIPPADAEPQMPLHRFASSRDFRRGTVAPLPHTPTPPPPTEPLSSTSAMLPSPRRPTLPPLPIVVPCVTEECIITPREGGRDEFFNFIYGIVVTNACRYWLVPHRPVAGSRYQPFFCSYSCNEALQSQLTNYIVQNPGRFLPLQNWLDKTVGATQEAHKVAGNRLSLEYGRQPKLVDFCAINSESSAPNVLKKSIPVLGNPLAMDVMIYPGDSKRPSTVLQSQTFQRYRPDNLLASTIAALQQYYKLGVLITDMRPSHFSFARPEEMISFFQGLGFQDVATYFSRPRGPQEPELECFHNDCTNAMLLDTLDPILGTGSATAVPVADMPFNGLCIRDPFTMGAAYLIGLVDKSVANDFLTNSSSHDYSVSIEELKTFVYNCYKANDLIYIQALSGWRENKVDKMCKVCFEQPATAGQQSPLPNNKKGRRAGFVAGVRDISDAERLSQLEAQRASYEEQLSTLSDQINVLFNSENADGNAITNLESQEDQLKLQIQTINEACQSLEPPSFRKSITGDDIAEFIFGLMRLSAVLMFNCLFTTNTTRPEIGSLISEYSISIPRGKPSPAIDVWWIPSMILTHTINYRLNNLLLNLIRQSFIARYNPQ